MAGMPSLPNHERRITTLEDIASSHSETLYKINRRLAKHDLWFKGFAERFHIREPTDDEVDELLDQE